LLSGAKLSISPTKALTIALAAALVTTIVIFTYQSSAMSSQLAEKSATIDLQNQQILEHTSTIASQSKELQDKTVELEDLNIEIALLDAEIVANEQTIAQKTAEAETLSNVVQDQRVLMQQLQSQALELQNEVNQLKQTVEENQAKITDLTEQVQTNREQLESAKRIKVNHHGVGVTESGQGVVFPIEVEVIGSGDGTISVDVKNVQYEASFQQAVRTAAEVASDYSGISISNKDIIIRFVNDPSNSLVRVDGGSAGALMTGMIIAALSDRQIESSVLLTGTIQQDGSIGVIGGLQSKTDAAAEFGAEMMLVPEDQEFYHDSIKVVGVSDIEDVMRYLAP
jgi:predicted ATP-dependent protease